MPEPKNHGLGESATASWSEWTKGGGRNATYAREHRPAHTMSVGSGSGAAFEMPFGDQLRICGEDRDPGESPFRSERASRGNLLSKLQLPSDLCAQ